MLIVNLLGVLIIGLIAWWFWLYKPIAVEQTNNDITVLVKDGSYSPARIKLKSEQQYDLKFMRRDASPCAEMLLIPELNISETLTVDQETTIALPKLSVGEYQFHCQMNMYKGVLVVV